MTCFASLRFSLTVLAVAILAAAVTPIALAEDDPLKPGEFEATVTLTIQADYLLYLPKDYEKQDKWPLMIFLHGAGERGDDLNHLKIHGPPKLIAGGKDFPAVVLAPQCPKHLWWYPEVLIELIDEIASTHKVDKSRIYLTGLSMGGYGTWALSAKHPKVFAAIAPICGGGDPKQAAKHAHIPTWVFHGSRDKTVPRERSDEMVAAIKKAGGEPRYTIYPEAGHDSWTESYDNPEFYEWMFKQRRGK